MGTQHRGDGGDTLVDYFSQPVKEILIRTTIAVASRLTGEPSAPSRGPLLSIKSVGLTRYAGVATLATVSISPGESAISIRGFL